MAVRSARLEYPDVPQPDRTPQRRARRRPALRGKLRIDQRPARRGVRGHGAAAQHPFGRRTPDPGRVRGMSQLVADLWHFRLFVAQPAQLARPRRYTALAGARDRAARESIDARTGGPHTGETLTTRASLIR